MENKKCKLHVAIAFVLSLSCFQSAQAFLLSSIQAAFVGGTAAIGIGAAGVAAFLLTEDDVRRYYIGDPWPGDVDPLGWVFYCEGEEPCENGLIISSKLLFEEDPWGCKGTEIGTKLGVGTGENNTKKIIKNCAERPIAASLAAGYSKSGFSNWFLPSKDELLLAYENLKDISGSIPDSVIWSSSEEEGGAGNNAYTVDLGSGTVFAEPKDSSGGVVLPVRAF